MNVFTEVDRLKRDLDNTTDEHKQSELLVSILKKYDSIKSTDGEPLIEKLQALAVSMNNITLQSYVHFFKGGIMGSRQEYPEAIEEFNKAVQILEPLNDKIRLTDCYNSIALIYVQQDRDAEALNYYLKSLKLAEETGQEREQVLIMFNMGVVYHGQGDSERALGCFKKAQEYFERIGEFVTLTMCCQNIGAILVGTERYAEAMPWYLKALDLANKTGDQPLIAALSSNVGLVDLHEGDTDSAIANYYKALEITEKLGDKQGLIAPLINLGEAYTFKKDYTKAIEYLQRAISLSEKIDAKRQLQEALRCMYVLYKEKGDMGKALEYYEQYVALTLELKGEDVVRKIASLEFEYKIEKKEQEVKLEREKKEEIQQAYHLLDKEKQRSESLLLNILPQEVAEELKETGGAKAKLFDNVTVFFSDFKSFTTVSERLTPQELVNELDACFRGFDEIIGKYGIEKIKTVGDAYLAVCGLPAADKNHAVKMVQAAFEIRNFMAERYKRLGNKTFEIRIGLHSGSVVAGIVGLKKFAYDIWGDTVNTAARMEQNGEPGKINISEATYDLVKDNFNCVYRGEIAAKNKGKLKMYFVEQR